MPIRVFFGARIFIHFSSLAHQLFNLLPNLSNDKSISSVFSYEEKLIF